MSCKFVHAVLLALWFAAATCAQENLIFSDSFQGQTLSPEWEVHEGQWSVADGALTCTDGGIISLKTLPGGSFVMEFEIAFPSYWMSVIPMFTAPDDYATLYFGGGYWESFQMAGQEIEDYHQHADAEIVRAGGFQKITVAADYGTVTFTYDGKARGPVNFPFRPGARVAFRSLPQSGLLKIRNFRLTRVEPAARKITSELGADDLARGVIWKDRGIEGKPGATPRLLSVDAQSGIATLNYEFSPDGQFESCFARIPAAAPQSGRVFMEIEGDNSRNNFFVIIHDVSGEQHLVTKSLLAWQGWQEVGINLAGFLTGPENMQRLAIHWGGDGNQKIDFPITALDVGVSKHTPHAASAGRISFRNVRFVE